MQDVSVDLTLDEVSVLCATLGLELPVGVAADEFEMPEEITARLEAAARSSLAARGILDATQGAAVNEAVATLLDLAAKPGLIVAVEAQRDGVIDLRFLLCDVDLGVEVSAFAPSAYRLTPFVTRDVMHRVIRATDLRPADVPRVVPVAVTRVGLERTIEAAQGGLDGAIAVL